MHEENDHHNDDDDDDDDDDDNDNDDDDDNNDDNDTDLMEFLHSHHLQTSSNREKMNRTACHCTRSCSTGLDVTATGLVVQG